MMYLFQSTPGQLAGRCGAPNVRVFRSGSFNPRPANWPGDAQRIGGEKAFSILFQSTPGQLAGRCGWMYYIYLPKYSFNPRPANWPGDAYCRPSCQYTRLGFNPRPANWPGDAEQLLPIPGTTEVSIHARPIGRAMPAIAFKPVTTPMFQSTPGQLAGRCLPGLVQQPAPRRFNPRPANWPGDALCRCRRTMLSLWFQSTPGQLAGRCTGISGKAGSVKAFQSTPGQLAGRCPTRSAPSSTAKSFNPRPANWPGDAHPSPVHPPPDGSFNPRPANWPGDAPWGARMIVAELSVSIHARPIGRAMPRAQCRRSAG